MVKFGQTEFHGHHIKANGIILEVKLKWCIRHLLSVLLEVWFRVRVCRKIIMCEQVRQHLFNNSDNITFTSVCRRRRNQSWLSLWDHRRQNLQWHAHAVIEATFYSDVGTDQNNLSCYKFWRVKLLLSVISQIATMLYSHLTKNAKKNI